MKPIVCLNDCQPVVVAVLGPNSSGKSSLAKSLKDRFGMGYFDMGDELRKNVDPSASATMNAGKLVDDQIVNQLLRSKVNDLAQSWSLCGVARKLSQAQSLCWYIDENPKTRLVVVEVHRSFDECNALRKERAKNEGRTDDREETFFDRWAVFNENIPLVRNFLQKKLKQRYLHLSLVNSLEENRAAFWGLLSPHCNFSVPSTEHVEEPLFKEDFVWT